MVGFTTELHIYSGIIPAEQVQNTTLFRPESPTSVTFARFRHIRESGLFSGRKVRPAQGLPTLGPERHLASTFLTELHIYSRSGAGIPLS